MGAYSNTGINNLDSHVDAGTYYARIKLKGNTIREANIPPCSLYPKLLDSEPSLWINRYCAGAF
jgi:hypothetical protein